MKKYLPVWKCLCCNNFMEAEHNMPPTHCPYCGEQLWIVVPDGTPVVYRDKCILTSAKKTILGWKEKR